MTLLITVRHLISSCVLSIHFEGPFLLNEYARLIYLVWKYWKQTSPQSHLYLHYHNHHHNMYLRKKIGGTTIHPYPQHIDSTYLYNSVQGFKIHDSHLISMRGRGDLDPSSDASATRRPVTRL